MILTIIAVLVLVWFILTSLMFVDHKETILLRCYIVPLHNLGRLIDARSKMGDSRGVERACLFFVILMTRSDQSEVFLQWLFILDEISSRTKICKTSTLPESNDPCACKYKLFVSFLS